MAKHTVTGVVAAVSVAALALVLTAPPLYTLAQNGPPPQMRAAMEKARADAKAKAYAGMSADHRAQVDGIVADLAAKKTTDMRGAAQRIDALLSDGEKQNVVAAWQAMRDGMQRRAPNGDAPPGGTPPDGAPPNGMPPASARSGGDLHAPESAGAILVRMSLTREQMKVLRPTAEGQPLQR
jgi:hypothetical protein